MRRPRDGLVALHPPVEPGDLAAAIVEARIADRPVANLLRRGFAAKGAVLAVGDHDGMAPVGVLLPCLLEESDGRARRNVIERLGPEARHADLVCIDDAVEAPVGINWAARKIGLDLGLAGP